MTDGFEVDDVALHTHAAQVDALAARMRAVAAAARPLDLDAYGQIGQVFAGAASEAARAGSLAVGSLAEQARAIADGVRATSEAYRAAERRTTTCFGEGR
jgi:Excreted virulence factor EspC, type VII ESX diderm